MSVEVKRKPNESNEIVLRRFQDKIRKSRVLNTMKKNRFFSKMSNKKTQKDDALARNKSRKKREYLIKIGKITENPRNKFYKR